MSFINILFYPAAGCLFAVIVLQQFLMRKHGRSSNTVSKSILLLFSFWIMYLYDLRFCLCMAAVILITYFAALLIEKQTGGGHERKKKILTRTSVILLVVILGVFKYLNFFMSSIMAAAGRSWTTLNIILPLGISFYIFSAIGYILDVSWGNMKGDRSLLDVALFLAFFPKQICGPIVKGREFLPQLKENRRVTLNGMEAGVQIFVFGLFKKMVIADHLAVFVDDVFYAPAAYGTMTLWLAVFGYFLQLYFDFSGYSDMAIGMSKIFGYDIPRNFDLPFIARNISEFWDRWHISLSSWLNEYIFNPVAVRLKRKLAGMPKDVRKRYRMVPTYAAVLVTFFVSGLWHGAGYTFIVWGLCQGVWSVIHAAYADWIKRKHRSFAEHKGKLLVVVDILATYLTLNIVQVFFRAESLSQAVFILKRMFTVNIGMEQPYTWAFFAYFLLAAATLLAYLHCRKNRQDTVDGYYLIMDLNTVRGLTVFFVVCGLTVMMAYFGDTYFIYGNF